MPNAALFIKVDESMDRFDGNGDFTFACWGNTSDSNHSHGSFDSSPIAWASSDVQIDNQLKDDMIVRFLADFNVTLTRSDIRIFR